MEAARRCVCVCMCVREMESERGESEKEGGRQRGQRPAHTVTLIHAFHHVHGGAMKAGTQGGAALTRGAALLTTASRLHSAPVPNVYK